MTSSVNAVMSDQQARHTALHPEKSFIVQAPAGSGKTELLIQRVLMLLAQVKHPEEILAITFTKKAALEMRTRLIQALENALSSAEIKSAHQQKTKALALLALENNERQAWHLLENPNRLRIQTIDAFNARLAYQLPIDSTLGASPQITDQPMPLYEKAVDQLFMTFEENPEWANDFSVILLYLNNHIQKMKNLFIKMLEKREEWLLHIFSIKENTELKHLLENNLKDIRKNIIQKTISLFPSDVLDSLCRILHVSSVQTFSESQWIDFSDLLLTQAGTWRKVFPENRSFPLTSEKKYQLKKLLENFSDFDALRLSLMDMREMPADCYPDVSWPILKAFFNILHMLVSELMVVFQAHGQIDYIQNAQAALCALGLETPTDFALQLDYQIQHILVDEFQDTSYAQWRLIEKLTGAWIENDGRTLFIVGDPQQSIYRFRAAEVSLFIQACEQGIGSVPLIPLTLTTNFRSHPAIIQWINTTFQKSFPAENNISVGAIGYTPSAPADSAEKDDATGAVTAYSFVNQVPVMQAHKIVDIILENKKKYPNDRIALLVRTRTHLTDIIPVLKAENIAYEAIEIDPLQDRSYIQDLYSLTKAMFHLGDRTHWLAILRAPWCGLSLAELWEISHASSERLIWDLLQEKKINTNRLNHMIDILKVQIQERNRSSFSDWIQKTWMLLGGPACLKTTAELNDCEKFFDLLREIEKGSAILELHTLEGAIERCFASVTKMSDNPLQIMTIHKAKGLEFDTVILPCLERFTLQDQRRLLLWMEQLSTQSPQLLFAPIHETGQEPDSIYRYIESQQKKKAYYETGRLLYVAATRAKKRLHLLANLKMELKTGEVKKPATQSFLHHIFDHVCFPIEKIEKKEEKIHDPSYSPKLLSRLKKTWQPPMRVADPVRTISAGSHFSKKWQPTPLAHAGTVIHHLLCIISRVGIVWWHMHHQRRMSYIKTQLLYLGVPLTIVDDLSFLVHGAIVHALEDERGRWILYPHHEAMSECVFTTVINDTLEKIIIDRTFIDETGTRWIIDYKTAVPQEDHIDTFIKKMCDEYRPQLEKYAIAMQHMGNHPIKTALYFTSTDVPRFIELS